MSLLVIASIISAILFGGTAILLSIKEEKIEKLLLEREEKVKKRAYEISLIKEIQDRVGYSLDIDKAVNSIVGSLRNLFNFSTTSILLIKDKKFTLRIYAEEAVSYTFIQEVKKSMIQAMSSLSNQTLPSTMEESITGTMLNNANILPVASFFNIPVTINNKVIGMINVSSTKSNLYTQEDVSVLYQIVTQSTSAISRLETVIRIEQEKLMAMIGSLADGVFMIDLHNQLTIINNAALSFLHITKQNPTIVDVLSVIPNNYNIQTKIQEAVSTNRMVKENEVKIGDNLFELFITPVANPQKLHEQEEAAMPAVIGVSVLLHDITLEKNLSQMKENFTNVIVHELRAPLTAIKDAAALLLDSQTNPDRDEETKLLNLINQQAKRLLQEVSSLLDAAKLESGRFTIQPTIGDLKKLIEERINFFEPQARNKQINLITHLDPLAQFSFDPLYIEQVINNLLSNSLKFTSAGGSITLSATERNGTAVVSVRDTGIGIPTERLPDIFTRFSNSSHTKSITGTGLGLYIVKGIVQAHGGSVELQSAVDQGTTITVILPMKNQVKQPEPHRPAFLRVN